MAYPKFDRWLYFNTADSDNNTIAFRSTHLYAVTVPSTTTVKLHFKHNGINNDDSAALGGDASTNDFATVILTVTSGKALEVVKEIWATAKGLRPPLVRVIADDANSEYIDNVTACDAITRLV